MSLRDAMNRMFDDSLFSGVADTRTARLPLDAYTTDDDIVVQVAVPGTNPDDVEITFEGDSLTIRGHTGERIENVNYIFAERFHGEFSRTLRLNVPIEGDKIEATFENGILTVVLPKAEAVKARTIKVSSK
jgi:HSP20 family protein